MKELKLCLPKEDREHVTKQMEQITNKRNRQVNHSLHAESRAIIDLSRKEGVGTLIVGKNALWKQEAGLGKRNNQNFVAIPHARFVCSCKCKGNSGLRSSALTVSANRLNPTRGVVSVDVHVFWNYK